MSKDISINITNNQTATSTLNNANNINNAPSTPVPPAAPRRTVFLSASDPSLAITVDNTTGNVFVAPFTGSLDQIFMTTFGLTTVSRIIPLSSPNSVLTSNEPILPTLDFNQQPDNFLVTVSPLSQVPAGRSIDWLITTCANPSNQILSRIGLTPSNWQITLPTNPLSQENMIMNPNLLLRPSGSDFITVFIL